MESRGNTIPLFSPSQVPDRERVLRSIWSPSPAKVLTSTSVARTPRRSKAIDVSSDQFFSPLATASPISVISEGTSFRTSIPVDMFSFDYVSTCQSEHELNQIVETLEHNNPGSYPSLLRTARRQLESIAAERKNVTWSSHNDTNHHQHHHRTMSPSNAEQSSLAMSLSTTNMLDDSLQVSPTPKAKSNISTSLVSSSKLFSFPEELFAEELDMVQEERRNLEHVITQQVNQLQQRLEHKHKTDIQDQRQNFQSLDRKIKDLEHARHAAETKVQNLESALHLSTSKHQSLLKSLECTQHDVAVLRQQLEFEKNQNQETTQAAIETEQRLQKELEQARINNKNSRLQVEESLEQSKADLRSLQNEQIKLLSVLQRAIGHDPALVASMSSHEKGDLIRNVTLKLASSKAAVKAFAQAMASAEKDRSTLREAHHLAQSRIKELKYMNERLKRENELLRQQNSNLQDRFDESHAQISTKMTGMQNQLQEYQETISLLRKQIRSSESSISLSLYQQTVAESRATQRKLEEKIAQVERLEQKIVVVQQMGFQMKEQYEKSVQERERVLGEHRRREAMHEHERQAWNLKRAALTCRQQEIHQRQQQGKERRMEEAKHAMAVLESTSAGPSIRIGKSSAVGMSMEKVHGFGKNPCATVSSTIASPSYPPPPPLRSVTPDLSTPLPETRTMKVGTQIKNVAEEAKATQQPPPAPPTRAVDTPRKIAVTKSPAPPKFPVYADSVGSQPPMGKSTNPLPNGRPTSASTPRAFKRLNAITAAGGRNNIREKLNTIRRSPLGNATNSNRGVVF